MAYPGISLESLLTAIPDAVFILDRDGRYLDLAPVGESLPGRPGSELVGTTLHELFPGEVADLFLETVRRALDTRQAVHLEYTLPILGVTTWYSATVTPAQPDAVVWVARDVTQLKRAGKMREVFARLGGELSACVRLEDAGQAALNAADELLGWDCGFVQIRMTEDGPLADLVAYELADGERRRVAQVTPDTDLGTFTEKTLREGGHLVLREETQDGSREASGSECRPASLMFVPIRQEGHPIGVLSIQSYTPRAYGPLDLELLQALADYCSGGVLRSLSEQKRLDSEQALAANERRFRALVENISEVVLLRDEHGRALYVSPAIEEILGYTPEEYAALEFDELTHPDEIAFGRAERQKIFGHPGRSITLEHRLRHRNGSWRWVVITATNLLHDPTVQATVINFSDITERKRSERMREVFASLGSELSRVVTSEEAAHAVLMAADTLFGWDAGFVNVLAEDEDLHMNVLVAYDQVEGQRVRMPEEPGDNLPGPNTRRALEQGAHLVHRTRGGPADESGFGDRARGSNSLMFAPMRTGGKPAGVISVQSYQFDAYSEQDLNLLQVLADYCSGALQRTVAEQRSRRSEEERRRTQRRYQALIENSSDAVVLLNEQGLVVYASPGVERITGHAPEEYLALPRFHLLHVEDLPTANQVMEQALREPGCAIRTEVRFAHKEGGWRWVDVAAQNLLDDPAVNALVANMRDVTDRKAAEEQLKHGAYHDALTGLPNRPAFLEQLSRAFARSERRPVYGYAVLFLDLDRFKLVNDSLGHLSGDKLLIEVARRLQHCLRSSDVAARFGGDEFAVLLEDVALPQDATRVAERILNEISTPFTIDGSEIFTSTSIGVAVSTTGYGAPDEMLRDADTAMYRAKALGKSRYALFDAEMHQRAVAQLQLETDLRHAIGRNELVLHYQPVVALDDGQVSGFEALVRWQHPERGLIAPGDFIPVAEETGMIMSIGWWVLTRACRWMREWQLQSSIGRRMSISVNLSGRQFAQADLATQIAGVLRETGLDPRCLKLEITEGAIIGNAETAIQILSQLKALEVQLHVDDFGTGYSSLAYLHRFPIDALKIDRSFVQNLGHSEEALQISRAVIALARNMGMEAIAEGIETPGQLEHLRSLGCRYGQGFLFSKPVPGEQARRFVDKVFHR